MKNKTCWKDDTGAVIQAHGGTILQYKDTWYWYGENKDAETINRRVKFIGFSCYSSKDLEHWHNEGLVLKASDDPEDDLYETCIAERPSVIYNKKTKKFILWFHLDNRDYTMASVGLAVSDFATGSFRYLGRQRPLGRDSRDLTVFQGNDEKAYLVHSSDWNSTMIIDRLDEDYTGFTGETTSICIDQYREAPVVMEYGSKYYMVTSGCTGWLPNSMLYAESDCMMGRWRLIDNPCSGRDYRKTFQ
ncbi:MAG: glycoside hydrolase family 43 protein, partial [Eubacteriales bacterium]|nr:glycoside hydrolase family 43 protein [Eubacteriales bacterium]